MSEDFRWWCGFDWASEKHHVWLLDATGRRLGERDVEHGGAGLGELCDWLIETTGGAPGEIAIAIETSSGPVVEMFLKRGFPVFSLNPKQLDRFRDRFSVAGAKDDSRDSRVLADSLRTDRQAFRRLSVEDPVVIELREWTRMNDDLNSELNRLGNRLREQLWRYYPQALKLAGADLTAAWFLALWHQAPTPAKAAKLRKTTVERILAEHRIRRLDAAHVLDVLRQKPLTVAPGATEAASGHIRLLLPRIRLVNDQIKAVHRHLDELCAKLEAPEETEPGQGWGAPRRDDPAVLAGSRKDRPRRDARRGVGASAATRLPRAARFVRSGARHPPQRQVLHRSAPLRLQQAPGRSPLSLVACRRSA
jgi:transposase